jgi:CheY-like chemotaxis protein
MPTILIIEDTDEMRTMLSSFLNRVGYETLEATNGLDGIKMARAHTPALILLDLMMPVAQGDLALGFIRSTAGISHIPVIVTSAHPGARRIAEQLGANDCLMKPFNLPELRDKINALIGSSS